MKKKMLLILGMLAVFSLIMTACGQKAEKTTAVNSASPEGSSTETTQEEVSLKDDFYASVNSGWLHSHEIPSDKSNVSALGELSDANEKVLASDFNDFLSGDQKVPEDLTEAVKMYQMAMDFDQLDKDGAAPLLPMMNKLEKINSLEELNAEWTDMFFDGYVFPFTVGCQADFKDATRYELWLDEPVLLLQEKDYYEDKESISQLQEAFKNMAVNLLSMTGKTKDDAEKIADQALSYDENIAQYLYNSEEKSDYTSLYHPMSLADLSRNCHSIDFTSLSNSLKNKPDRVILTNDKFFFSIDKLICKEEFSKLKSWMLTKLLVEYSQYLSNDFRVEAGSFDRALSGTSEASAREKDALKIVCGRAGLFDEPVGVYYGKEYFGEEARDDVTEMIKKIVSIYRDRLSKNDWLSKDTIDEAITKLDHIIIRAGYPDQAESYYSLYRVKTSDEGGSLLENVLNFNKIYWKSELNLVGEKYKKNRWVCTADIVNAFYNPSDNSINIPAGILQAPVYSKNQSESANYGGIGMVIAHEISHAFDPSGSKFDENGSLKNWWTQEDQAEFDRRSAAVVKQFDGVESQGGSVNGTLTLGENVADLGGISCAFDAAKLSKDTDLEAFFKNYAAIWAMKSKDKYASMLLKLDNHAPAKLRVNLLLPNLEDFFTTFDIQPGDGMYRAPDDRISIW